jgi:branched-chain amino acid transport system substrate-binding protein
MSAKTVVWGVFSCAMVMIGIPNAPAQETIRVAGVYAVTGTAAPSNVASLQGARLAVQALNRTGGVLGKKLELVEFDNQSTPIGSKVATDRAIRMGAVAILGSAWSSHSLAVARVAQKRAIPMVTNVSTNPDVTRVGDYIFRVCYIDPFQGGVMARFAYRDLEARSAVVIQDVSSDYSLGLAAAFQRGLEAQGGRILSVMDYKHHQESFDDTVLRAREADPEIVFLPGHDECGAIIRKAREVGVHCAFLGGDGWEAKSFFDLGGPSLGTGYFCTHWSEEVGTEASREFVALYQQQKSRSKGPVLAAAALAYDAVMLIADALERAGTTDAEALQKTLARTEGFKGVTGSLSFDRFGDPVKEAVIMALSKGGSRYLKRVSPLEE